MMMFGKPLHADLVISNCCRRYMSLSLSLISTTFTLQVKKRREKKALTHLLHTVSLITVVKIGQYTMKRPRTVFRANLSFDVPGEGILKPWLHIIH